MQEEMTKIQAAYERLRARGLFPENGGSLSMRLTGGQAFLFLKESGFSRVEQIAGTHSGLELIPFQPARLHASIYRLRPDVGAIVVGGSAFGNLLNRICRQS